MMCPYKLLHDPEFRPALSLPVPVTINDNIFDMKTLSLLIIGSFFLLAFRSDQNDKQFVKTSFQHAQTMLKKMSAEAGEKQLLFPRTTDKEGKLVATNMYDWTPGFFAGSLWYTYEYTKDESLKKAATEWTEKLEPLKTFTEHHDLGFMMYCSYGNAYRITKKEAYKDILLQSAKSLSTRFNPVTGTIKSWNTFASWHGEKKYNFPVIIDNMMNLELLFFASKISGDTSFRHVAVTHALNTMKNQIRPDFSSYHVVCYDTVSGKVLARETAQGYSDNSTWSRGQAWGIYGFTMAYRETRDPRFLKTAKGMADFYLNSKTLPADGVPYWDFNAGQPGYTPGVNSHAKGFGLSNRDASAAAITASALFELANYPGTSSKRYRESAIKILRTLSGPEYLARENTNGNFLLKHSVGSIAHGFEIDSPLVYADYYYLEALKRYADYLGK
jgi:unsaturated chondroitin disaccharide hydrolase